MEKILLLMVFPIMFAVGFWIFAPKRYTLYEALANVGIVLVLVIITYVTATYSNLHDTEIWNGEVVSKHRYHDTYEESYDCRCRTVPTGSGKNRSTTTKCDTCYRTHYTVDWVAKTTLGNITLKSLDSTNSGVYNTPDPNHYVSCYPGEPVSDSRSYVNYVKAQPQSIFNTYGKEPTYKNKIPEYPVIHSYYKINRVINVDSKVPQEKINQLNLRLSESLKKLGKQKQVNIVAIVTEIDDNNYRYDVENTWIGGKKNDIIVFLGMDGEKFTWVDVMTWASNSGNELFTLNLSADLNQLGNFDVEEINRMVSNNIKETYNRPKMEQFEYLKDTLEPSDTVMFVMFFVSVVLTLVIGFLFHKHDVF